MVVGVVCERDRVVRSRTGSCTVATPWRIGDGIQISEATVVCVKGENIRIFHRPLLGGCMNCECCWSLVVEQGEVADRTQG
jgi:hypothetical protein